MITFKTGDMFTEKFDIIINTINVVGVMGKGVALLFKQRYPNLFTAYQEACKANKIKPGTLWYYFDYENNQFIINFATKDHWKDPSKYEWIENGLIELKEYLDNSHIPWRIGMPMIGCGCGFLDEKKVKSLIEKYLTNSIHDIVIFTRLSV